MQHRDLAGKMHLFSRMGLLCLLLFLFSCDPNFDPEDPPTPKRNVVTEDIVDR